MLVPIHIAEFQPRKGASFVVEHLSLIAMVRSRIIVRVASVRVQRIRTFVEGSIEGNSYSFFSFFPPLERAGVKKSKLARKIVIASIGKI